MVHHRLDCIKLYAWCVFASFIVFYALDGGVAFSHWYAVRSARHLTALRRCP